MLKGIRFRHCMVNSVNHNYHVHFMRGNTLKQLSPDDRHQFLQFIAEDPQSDSFLTYDERFTQQRIQEWKQKLPWIKPFYAIKSNPLTNILHDVQQ